MNSANIKSVFLYIIIFLSSGITGFSQKNYTAETYMITMSNEYRRTSESFLSYSSAVAHSNSARKVEKKRTDLIGSVAQAEINISHMPCFQEDCSLRDSMVSFLGIAYYVLTDDYSKILNMEEIAEQSYDLMEAYMLAREKADEKMNQAGISLENTQTEFAARHNVRLSDEKDKLSLKIEQINKVSDHYTDVYLVFFKSYKQEIYLLDALERKDFSSAEQNRNALIQTVVEGQAILDTLKAYRNDKSLIYACKRTLTFYNTEAAVKMPIILDFLMKNENFEKIKKAFDEKSTMERTSEEVDNYNKAVAELNKSARTFDTNQQYINQYRKSNIENWNTISHNYLEKYIPKSN